MSFLAEVLASARNMDINTILEKAPKAVDSVDAFRDEMQKYLENVYVTFAERPRQSKRLAEKASMLKEELLTLNVTFNGIKKEDLNEVDKELVELKTEVRKSLIAVGIIDKIIRVHNDLLKVRELRESGKLAEGMQVIIGLNDLIDSVFEEEKTEALHELCLRVKEEENLIVDAAFRVFKDCVKLIGEKDIFVMEVSKDEKLQDIISALYEYCESVIPLNEVIVFVGKLLENVVARSAEIEVNCRESARLTIKFEPDSTKPDYKLVFSNITSIVSFLIENFNYALSDKMTSMDYIGAAVRNNLEDILIQKCLQLTIPITKEGLEDYKTIASNTLSLEKKLKETKILEESSTALSDFVGNIDEHFVNKICEELLKASLTLMKKDLHDMVASETCVESLDSFPQCNISKSCFELLRQLEDMLQRSLTMEEPTRKRVVATIKHILIQYQFVVPEHHQKLLQTIPQQVALLHNNCMFISHTITTWTEHFQKDNLASSLNLILEEQYKIKQTGTMYLDKCVKEQIQQIDDIIEDSGLTALHLKDEFPQTAEKSIRQCLRQQELLKTIWHKVLPRATYDKTIGHILDHFCSSLIKPILMLEDISSTLSENLVEVFKVVVTRAPKLLSDPREVHLHVDSWNKFNELIFVLNASLAEINDRWADRKGPLAAAFRAEELRNLIKALFQNTDRRAYVLGKIF